MDSMGRRLLAAGILTTAVALPARAADRPEKVNVLIVDGQNGHDWKATTPVIRDMLLKTERFSVDVATSPPAKGAPRDAWDAFRPGFAKYGVVVVNYAGQPWPAEVQKAFEKYVDDGGGVVAYHFAVSSWPQWAEWNKMIGLGWRDAKFGDRLYLDEAGKLVRQPKGEGPGRGHGPGHAFEVTVRDANHPIMRGFPAKWVNAKDELYHGQRGPAENMHILLSSFSAKDKGGTGVHEPMAWTVSYGKGRVFVDLLGHDATCLAHAGSAAMLCRGAEWAATGKVTLPAPKDLSAAATPPAK